MLQLFATLRMSAAITVTIIIFLASVLILNTLTMTVLDKVREIAILRSMGYRRFDIGAIFLFQGFLVATFGSVLGALRRRVDDLRDFVDPAQAAGPVFRRSVSRCLERKALHIRDRSSPLSPC